MNSKTAQHLNLLRNQAAPVTVGDPLNRYRLQGPSTCVSALMDQVWKVLDATHNEAQRQEIMKSAEKREEAAYYWPGVPDRGNDSHSPVLVWRAFDLARPQIQALVDRDNARRLAAYEAYRLACEQGVAVPPTE